MATEDLAVEVEGISKYYRLGIKEESNDSLAQILFNVIKKPIYNYRKYRSLYDFKDIDKNPSNVLKALVDVSFKVKKGERIGIVGSNGAGKSTLLKVLSRITSPSRGVAKINGRISSLLEVGTGFHPELTGKENVYLNGTVLGMKKKEIDNKFEEIVDFSGVEQFLETPVKRYSSGMKVRLAFAVAAHLEPEILIVDEVLAVGDAAFQEKCISKMEDVGKSGRTVLFVSHNMGAIRQLCDRALWLDRGYLKKDGDSDEIISAYMGYGKSTIPKWYPNQDPVNTYIKILSAQLIHPKKNTPSSLTDSDHPLRLEVQYEILQDINNGSIHYRIKDMKGNTIYTSRDTDKNDSRVIKKEAGKYVSTTAMPPFLKPGRYILTIGASEGLRRMDDYKDVLSFEITTRGCKVNHQRAGIILPILDWDSSYSSIGESSHKRAIKQ